MTDHPKVDRTGTSLTSDDRFAILEVLYTYCELLDAFEFEQMAHKVFTEDSRENHGYGLDTVHGRAQIAQLFTRLMSPYEGSMHNLSNVRFTQRSDGAVFTRSYFRAYHWLKETGPDPMRPSDFMVLSGNTLLIPVPETLSTEDALLFNPLGAGFAWAIDRGRVGVGDSVLVVGAGQRGLACAAASAVAGAGRVVVAGIFGDEFKLDLARRLGATETVVIDPSNAESLIDQVGADGFDCVVDVAPRATQPIIDAVAAVRRGGRVVLAGLKGRPVPELWSDAIVLKGITVAGARSVDRQSFVLAMSALERGLVRADEWHTHRYELDELETALLVQGGEKRTTKVPLHVTILSDDAVR